MSVLLERSLAAEDSNGEAPDVVFVAMLTPSHAVDQFLGDLSRRSRSKEDRSAKAYRRTLDRFCDQLPNVYNMDVSEITPDDCRRFLDLCARKVKGSGRTSQGTQATIYSHLNSFFEWLYQQERIKKNPMDRIQRSKRPKPEDLDVTKVSTADVPKLLGAAQTWTEKLAVAIPVYMGPRRSAVASLRVRDWNREQQKLRFFEKGSKIIWKPVPGELTGYLEAAYADGAFKDPDDYLVPPEGHLSRADRDDRVIWRVIKRVADRAGVEAHVHALRAAFAVFYLSVNTGDVEGLKELMGHESIATTQTYLRMLDREAAMERVRSLSWGVAPDANGTHPVSPQIAGNGYESLALSGGGRI